MVFTLIFIFSGCSGSEVPSSDVSQEGSSSLEEYIIMKGLGEEEISISVEEIKGLQAISKEVTSISSTGEENTFQATGALLEDVLKQRSFNQKDLMGLRIVAGDGYSIEVPKEIVGNRDIILAYEMNGAPLDEQSRPLRVVIPDERAMYWVGNLETIEILEKIEKSEIHKLLFIEALGEIADVEDYIYYDSIDKAIKIQDLLKSFGEESTSKTVYIKAVDGLEKNETLPIFQEGYIKVTGADVPAFLSPNMPKGMYVKHILYFSYDTTAWVAYEKAQEKLGTLNLEDREGISVEELLKEIGLHEGEAYIFTAIDGYAVEVDASDLGEGIIYLDEKGRLNTYFKGLPKNTSIKDLLSVEVKK